MSNERPTGWKNAFRFAEERPRQPLLATDSSMSLRRNSNG